VFARCRAGVLRVATAFRLATLRQRDALSGGHRRGKSYRRRQRLGARKDDGARVTADDGRPTLGARSCRPTHRATGMKRGVLWDARFSRPEAPPGPRVGRDRGRASHPRHDGPLLGARPCCPFASSCAPPCPVDGCSSSAQAVIGGRLTAGGALATKRVAAPFARPAAGSPGCGPADSGSPIAGDAFFNGLPN
jgi:hypothetical protein